MHQYQQQQYFFYISIKFTDIFTKTQFKMSALEHARSMCGPIP